MTKVVKGTGVDSGVDVSEVCRTLSSGLQDRQSCINYTIRELITYF